jgi:integrase
MNQWPAYLKWRNGRPRWEPGPGLRAAGFAGRDLKDAAGDWLAKGAAVEAADALNREIDEWRLTGAIKKPKASKKHPRSCEALADLWQASPRYARKKDNTKRDYQSKLNIFKAEFGDIAVAALSKADLYTWWEELYTARGHAMANGIIAVVRAVLSYGVMKGWRHDNPAKQLGLETVPVRCVVWTPSEIERLVETADKMELYSGADAVVVALHTGQRESDCLSLKWQKAAAGRAIFKQAKTGARVAVPFTPALEARLAAIQARRSTQQIVPLDAEIVLSEKTGLPYNANQFSKLFRKVRAEAAKGNFVSIADKQFLDLRDTAVTRLALAGCTIPEIRAITGHTLETVHQILQHYLAMDDRMAAAGIERLKAWMTEEGIAI